MKGKKGGGGEREREREREQGRDERQPHRHAPHEHASICRSKTYGTIAIAYVFIQAACFAWLHVMAEFKSRVPDRHLPHNQINKLVDWNQATFISPKAQQHTRSKKRSKLRALLLHRTIALQKLLIIDKYLVMSRM